LIEFFWHAAVLQLGPAQSFILDLCLGMPRFIVVGNLGLIRYVALYANSLVPGALR